MLTIAISDFLKIADKVEIIDMRSIENYNNNHILNARNIQGALLSSNPSKYLKYNTVYYIYCQRGTQSIRLCKLLNSQGYTTISISGGYENWLLSN